MDQGKNQPIVSEHRHRLHLCRNTDKTPELSRLSARKVGNTHRIGTDAGSL